MLTITDATWQKLLTLLGTGPPGVERVAYLDGIKIPVGDGTIHGVVTTVTVPHAQQYADHFTVSAEEMSRAGQHLRTHGLARLAQVHTHPGSDTRHSPYDDKHAYSRKAGAISIVLPWHAHGDPLPTGGSVHLHDGERWHGLSPDDATAFIRLAPATVDTRRPSPLIAPTPDGGSSRSRSSSRRWEWWATLWAHVTRRR